MLRREGKRIEVVLIEEVLHGLAQEDDDHERREMSENKCPRITYITFSISISLIALW